MTNTRTNKVRKTNKKFIATICAVVAATAMVTGIAVFTASASKNDTAKNSPTSVSQIVSDKSTDSSSQASTVQQAPVQQQNIQQAPVQQQDVQQAPVQQQDVQQAPVQQQNIQQAPVQQQNIQQTPVQQQTVQQSAQDSKPVIPQGEVNDWKTHDAKDGFPIGSYFSGKSTLVVNKLDNVKYAITVTVPTGNNTAVVYNISAAANGSKMYYSGAVKSSVEYDANGNVVNTAVIDNNHKGTFDASDAGYTWADTEGTTVFVPWVGYPYAK